MSTRPFRKVLGEVRRSQVVTTYGVGAIVPVEEESFMIAGIDRWRSDFLEDIHERRLEQQLGLSRLCLPPAGRDAGDIPVVRFPLWATCPTCRRLAVHEDFCGKYENKCNADGAALVPSRFVAACANGHIQDFPYFDWVHTRQAPPTGTRHSLSIETAGASASLRSIEIRCACGLARSMEGAFSEWALREVVRCHGSRPWLLDFEGDCAESLRTLQRGASNVYFGIQRSALSIPPWSEEVYKKLDSSWTSIKYIPKDALLGFFAGQLIGNWRGLSASADELTRISLERLAHEESSTGVSALTEEELRKEEYDALCRGKGEEKGSQEFVAVPAQMVGDFLSTYVEQIMLVKRLREVRVLEGFTRLQPWGQGDPQQHVAPLFKVDPGWLPAIEVTGEGVFFKVSNDRLVEWEKRSGVEERAQKIEANALNGFSAARLASGGGVSARLIVLHSLAHALISQWSLECGYPAASIRERLYVSGSMAGILLYTATTDSAGSLGGIVAQADSDRLEPTFRGAIEASAWCSSDPLCIESLGSGVDSLNLAACHACLLLPEVSCELGNVFLDRALLVGTPDEPNIGLFSSPR